MTDTIKITKGKKFVFNNARYEVLEVTSDLVRLQDLNVKSCIRDFSIENFK